MDDLRAVNRLTGVRCQPLIVGDLISYRNDGKAAL
jgi:hypothetical protein